MGTIKNTVPICIITKLHRGGGKKRKVAKLLLSPLDRIGYKKQSVTSSDQKGAGPISIAGGVRIQ